MPGHLIKASAPPSDPSWWFQEALRYESGAPAAPALSGEITADVAIVGGGFTGMWTALALKARQPDIRIALIEASLCGSGASGKNGGIVHGYWAALPRLRALFGDDAALAVARAGAKAMAAISAFAKAPGRDIWLHEDGNIRLSTTPVQDSKITDIVEAACALGVPEQARFLRHDDLPRFLRTPVFRNAVHLSEGGTLHPGRLARALRKAIIDAGVALYENTAMIGLDRDTPNRVRTAGGQIVARDVVLANYAALANEWEVRPYITLFSSFALATEPAPEKLAEMGWNIDPGMNDMRMFVHYFRKLEDGRFLIGTGGGPLAYGGNARAPQLTGDDMAVARIEAAQRRLFPALAHTRTAKSWGGAIDICSDRFPIFKTIPGTRVHYGIGYTGHGINPTYIGGQCLASLVLGQRDMWTGLPFCTRDPIRMPPEPFRYIGGCAIRAAIITCEDAEDRGLRGSLVARATAAIPKALGLRIGTR